MENREIEAKFLEVDVKTLKQKLVDFQAKDLGEEMFEETIIYDKDLKWLEQHGEFLRLRISRQGTILTYKNHQELTVDGTEEIEFVVGDAKQAEQLLEKLGYIAFRRQQKKRHSYVLDNVKVEFDTWPKVPTYLELEGESEVDLQKAAVKLGLDWKNAVFESARITIENRYKIPVGHYRIFTFDKIE